MVLGYEIVAKKEHGFTIIVIERMCGNANMYIQCTSNQRFTT
jgi:hypothetical protein